MDLTGDEKRIQALFCELRAEDQALAPPFEISWRRAQAATWLAQNAPSTKSFAITFAGLLIATICLLIFWSQSRQDQQNNEAVVHSSPTSFSSSIRPTIEPAGTIRFNNSSQHAELIRRPRKLKVAQKTHFASQDLILRTAVAISNWQSPTATLVRSPTSSTLNSLPQLNDSVRELQSFLPNQ